MSIGDPDRSAAALPASGLDEARLRRLVDALQVGVIVQGPRSEVLYCNARAGELLGIAPREMLGRTSLDVGWAAIHPNGDPFPGADHPGPRVLATGRPVRDLLMGWRRAGQDAPVWLLVNADPERDEAGNVHRVVCTFTDVTGPRAVEERLRESEARYRQLVETAQDIIYRTDRLGFFTYVNPQASRVMGWPAGELVGTHFLELIREDHRARVEERLRAQYRERTPTTYDEFVAVTRDGREVWIGQNVQLLGEGHVQGFQAVARDITARKAAELELMEATRLKSEFLAHVSQELRTPLGAVLGMTRLLFDSPLDASQRECVEGIRDAGRQLLAAVDAILDFSELEAGRVTFDRVDLEPRVVADQALRGAAEVAQRKGLRISSTVAEDVPCTLRGDPARLGQALQAVLANAVKFTREGSVGLRVAVERASRDEVAVRFEVADTGPGIPRDVEPRLFEPFTRSSAPGARRQGAGLGLAIARRLVEGMRGEMGWRSVPGRGSTFWIVVPLARPDEGHAAGADRPPLGRVLVVEDNPVNRRVAMAMLEAIGYAADAVENGLEALQACEAARYDAILMDCQMPEMDGFRTTAFLREREGSHRRTPIIAVTASVRSEDRDECLAAGMDDYLAKPVRLETLAETLRRWVTPAAEPRTAELPHDHPLRALEAQAGPAVYLEVLDAFLQSTPRRIQEMREALLREDRAALRALAHSLKGAAAQLGAPGIADLCAQVEGLAGQEAFAAVDHALAALETDYRSVQRVLERERRRVAGR